MLRVSSIHFVTSMKRGRRGYRSKIGTACIWKNYFNPYGHMSTGDKFQNSSLW